MSAFEYLENLVNSVFGGNDLKDYDVVVELDVGTHAVSDDPILFVSKDGVGEYIDIPAKDIEAQKSDGGITLKTISDLQNDSSVASADAAAIAGAKVIISNLGVYNAGNYPDLPFDPESPETTASAIDLDDIKSALDTIRGDLINNASPDAVYTESADIELDYLKPKDNVEELQSKIEEVDNALFVIDETLGADDILNSMEEGLKDAELTTHQKSSVLEEIVSDAMQEMSPAVDAVQAVKVGM